MGLKIIILVEVQSSYFANIINTSNKCREIKLSNKALFFVSIIEIIKAGTKI